MEGYMDLTSQKNLIETDATNLERYWTLRNTQVQEDLDIINLIKPIEKTDEKNWVDNEPKVFFDTSRSLLSIYPPRFRLPLSINFSPEEKDKMNKAERFLIGIYRSLDNKCADKGECMWLWQLAYWVLLGWYAVFTMVQKTNKGTEFIADIWNPMTVYPEWSGDGLVKCLRIYETDAITARSIALNLIESGEFETEYLEGDVNERKKIINYWRQDDTKVFNAIMVSGQLIKPLTLQKKLKRIPVHIGAIGSPDKLMPQWEKRKGESIIASTRDIDDYYNQLIRLYAEIVEETAYPNIATKTRSGLPPFKSEDLKGHSSVIPLKLEDQIELLKHAASPTEANILLQYFGNQRQKGSLPASVYGSIPFEVSGFALSQLMAAIKYKLGPYLLSMQQLLSRIMVDFLSQYESGNFASITLNTENPYALKRGMTYIEEFGKEDVPKHKYVDVTIPITSQFDKTQAILNAVQASQAGILSLETLWEETLDIQDTEQEKQRLREDQVNRDPFVINLEIIMGLWRKYEFYKDVEKNLPMAEALKRYIQAKEAELGITTPKQTKKLAGIPPQVLPAEMTTSPSPDQLGAMQGKPPPGVTRSPETAEVEAAKGIVIPPTGE